MSGPIIYNMEQGDLEWRIARLGMPTASEFATVMAKGKDGGASITRARYMRRLAGERITGEPAESYSNHHMDRGKVMEDEARDLYAMMRDVEPLRVGFIRNGDKGCSPDSLIGDKGGLEIKTAIPEVQIERLLRNDLPPEHRAQVQGSLWVAEREFWDFVSFWPKMRPLIVRVTRDDKYIRDLEREVATFNDELDALVDRLTGNSDRLREQLRSSVLLAG